ncbi:MAG: carboxypeptidase-like regulatory domain-containing protein [Gammaproteobacteria bacterium]|nr:carboxypeptidase-like regulatory domain-containing protein [Gammaproteobacteria bacterium]
MRTIIVALITGSLFFNNVWADHEADHRYNIRGYVLDADRKGIHNLTVQAFADGVVLGTGKTGADGYYSLHLHLHNSDYHRILKLRAGSQEAEVRVTFDREDDTSARIHEANFVGGELIEGDLGRFRIPAWSYVVGGLLLFLTVLVFLEKRRKKKIRLAKFGTSEMHTQSGHRAKKSRRRKH